LSASYLRQSLEALRLKQNSNNHTKQPGRFVARLFLLHAFGFPKASSFIKQNQRFIGLFHFFRPTKMNIRGCVRQPRISCISGSFSPRP
jgi:hypothetical protein